MGYSGLDPTFYDDEYYDLENKFVFNISPKVKEEYMAQMNSAHCECVGEEGKQCDLCNGKHEYKFIAFHPGMDVTIVVEQERDKGLMLSHIADYGMFFRNIDYEIPNFKTIQEACEYHEKMRR